MDVNICYCYQNGQKNVAQSVYQDSRFLQMPDVVNLKEEILNAIKDLDLGKFLHLGMDGLSNRFDSLDLLDLINDHQFSSGFQKTLDIGSRSGAANKCRSMVSYRQFSAFDRASLSCNDHHGRRVFQGPGRFPGIAGNARNHRNDGKFHESHKILNQIQRNINKLCLGKILRQKAVRIKFSVDSAFSYMVYGKKRKPGNAANQQKAF